MPRYWTHPSVLLLADRDDPISIVTQRARDLALSAMAEGWSGPPFNPFELADHLRIQIVPTDDVRDARTVPGEGEQLRIEFNPTRHPARIRYSIAHEIAHSFFPDCRRRVRNRLRSEHLAEEDWQLEMLCNIGAAELLMPVGSFPSLSAEELSIDHLMKLRDEYGVSSEALLLRVARLTAAPCMVFASSRNESTTSQGYRIDYARPSRAWGASLPSGIALPKDTILSECAAIGFTAKGDEIWPSVHGHCHVECVGIPPYPGRQFPRVVGVLQPKHPRQENLRMIKYVKGDATTPRGKGRKLLIHVVNDKAIRWGGRGFATSLRVKYPSVHDAFREWASVRGHLSLASIHYATVGTDLVVASMIAQHGYGPSSRSRIRYDALGQCLNAVAEYAQKAGTTVHMPRIGTGQAGGEWAIVGELVEDALLERGLDVTVYDLPHSQPNAFSSSEQPALSFGTRPQTQTDS